MLASEWCSLTCPIRMLKNFKSRTRLWGGGRCGIIRLGLPGEKHNASQAGGSIPTMVDCLYSKNEKESNFIKSIRYIGVS